MKFVCSGLVDPKSRSKDVGDGHPVNIPELSLVRIMCLATLFSRSSSDWKRMFLRKEEDLG